MSTVGPGLRSTPQSEAEVMNLVMNAALGAGGEPEKRSAITGRVRVRVSKRRSSVCGAEI